MARKRWYSFHGIVARTLSASTEVTQSVWQVVVTATNEVVETFETQEQAIQYVIDNRLFPPTYRTIQNVVTTFNPADSEGHFLVPLTPLPVFSQGGTVLTTRGFWDVVVSTVPTGNVATFAFGLCFLPVGSIYDISTETVQDVPVDSYTLKSDLNLPRPLFDDIGWHAYDSFVRLTTRLAQDPPFHSKTRKRFSAHSALCFLTRFLTKDCNVLH